MKVFYKQPCFNGDTCHIIGRLTSAREVTASKKCYNALLCGSARAFCVLQCRRCLAMQMKLLHCFLVLAVVALHRILVLVALVRKWTSAAFFAHGHQDPCFGHACEDDDDGGDACKG